MILYRVLEWYDCVLSPRGFVHVLFLFNTMKALSAGKLYCSSKEMSYERESQENVFAHRCDGMCCCQFV